MRRFLAGIIANAIPSLIVFGIVFYLFVTYWKVLISLVVFILAVVINDYYKKVYKKIKKIDGDAWVSGSSVSNDTNLSNSKTSYKVCGWCWNRISPEHYKCINCGAPLP